MKNTHDSASQIEKFHQLASHGLVDLDALYSQELVDWLIQFVSNELVGLEPPSVNSSAEFANVLHVLGSNKRAWSQRLGSLILELMESQTKEEIDQSTMLMHEFISNCPWKFLSESARKKL